jgi:pilus assembly protein Flp/PilA
MSNLFRAFSLSRAGASAAEYALIVAVLGTFVVAGTIAFGNSLETAMENSGNALSATR